MRGHAVAARQAAGRAAAHAEAAGRGRDAAANAAAAAHGAADADAMDRAADDAEQAAEQAAVEARFAADARAEAEAEAAHTNDAMEQFGRNVPKSRMGEVSEHARTSSAAAAEASALAERARKAAEAVLGIVARVAEAAGAQTRPAAQAEVDRHAEVASRGAREAASAADLAARHASTAEAARGDALAGNADASVHVAAKAAQAAHSTTDLARTAAETAEAALRGAQAVLAALPKGGDNTETVVTPPIGPTPPIPPGTWQRLAALLRAAWPWLRQAAASHPWLARYVLPGAGALMAGLLGWSFIPSGTGKDCSAMPAAEAVKCETDPAAMATDGEHRLDRGQVDDGLRLLQEAARRKDGHAMHVLGRFFDPSVPAPRVDAEITNARTAARYYAEARAAGVVTDTDRERLRAWLSVRAAQGITMAKVTLHDFWEGN
jgi:hypothetical protein